VEAGVVAGTEKQYSSITLDSAGTIYELPDLIKDSSGYAMTSDWKNLFEANRETNATPKTGPSMAWYDNATADVWAKSVVLRGAVGGGAAMVLIGADDKGVDTQIEVRTTTKADMGSTSPGVSYLSTTLTASNTNVPDGAVIDVSPNTAQAAVVSASQVSRLSFSSSFVPGAGSSLSVTVTAGTASTVTVKVGDTVNGQTVTATWGSLLSALSFELAALDAIDTAVVDATARTLTLTGSGSTVYTLDNLQAGNTTSGPIRGAVSTDGSAASVSA
jgi:hypothetical protein